MQRLLSRRFLPVAFALLACATAVGAQPPAYRVEIAPGAQEETVFSWSRDRCEIWHIPDAPLRAFRNDHGDVVAFASHYRARALTGRKLDGLASSCAVSFEARNSPDPSDFSDKSWIAATWTGDGRRIFALMHDEYHAHRHPGACLYTEAMKCWYNVVTTATSTDSGGRFTADEPRRLVAAPRFRQDVGQGRHRGFFNPSNIVVHDGAWYTLIATSGGEGQKNGVCLFRSADIADPATWRAFDGADFSLRALDPYREDTSAARPCQPLKGLPTTVGSLTRHEASGRWLALFHLGPDPARGIAGGRVAYSWSDDLLTWSALETLVAHPTLWSKDCGDTVRYAYGALADPSSPSRNFDSMGDGALLFMTKLYVADCKVGPQRDLIRIRVRVVKDGS